MKFSIVIPARDEQACIGACLRSIAEAARPFPGEVETIVVLNRCTDGTEQVSREHGATIVREDAKNLATIRNAGAREANGDILVTIDADSTMTPNLLTEVDRLLATGKYVGGGTMFKLDRMSLGMALSSVLAVPLVLILRVAAGAFWLRRRDFEALGGFDESRLSFEDVEFARRLKALGRRQGKRFKILLKAYIHTSARKFDRFGHWYFFFRPWLWITFLRGRDRAAADLYWYDTPRD